MCPLWFLVCCLLFGIWGFGMCLLLFNVGSWWLLVGGCCLLVVVVVCVFVVCVCGCLLFGCLLFVDLFLLVVVCYLLCVVRCQLCIVRCLLFVVWCLVLLFVSVRCVFFDEGDWRLVIDVFRFLLWFVVCCSLCNLVCMLCVVCLALWLLVVWLYVHEYTVVRCIVVCW